MKNHILDEGLDFVLEAKEGKKKWEGKPEILPWYKSTRLWKGFNFISGFFGVFVAIFIVINLINIQSFIVGFIYLAFLFFPTIKDFIFWNWNLKKMEQTEYYFTDKFVAIKNMRENKWRTFLYKEIGNIRLEIEEKSGLGYITIFPTYRIPYKAICFKELKIIRQPRLDALRNGRQVHDLLKKLIMADR